MASLVTRQQLRIQELEREVNTLKREKKELEDAILAADRVGFDERWLQKLRPKIHFTKMEARVLLILLRRRQGVHLDGLYNTLYADRPECDQPISTKGVMVFVCRLRRKMRAETGHELISRRQQVFGGYILKPGEHRDKVVELLGFDPAAQVDSEQKAA